MQITSNALTCRSLLFVPANRPDRFDKALSSGADMICIDLEDAIQLDQKDEVRSAALDYAAAPSAGKTVKSVRINSVTSLAGLKDLLYLSQMQRWPNQVLLPKVGQARDIKIVREILGPKFDSLSLFALLETCEGVDHAVEIAAQTGVQALLFGSADWSAECGSDMSWDTLLSPRSQIVQAATRAGIRALDGVWLDVNDEQGLQNESRKIVQMGFSGKALIHPKQIEAVHQAFQPSPNDIENARHIVEAFKQSADGVLIINGRMIDKPVVVAAQKTLTLAGLTASGDEEL